MTQKGKDVFTKKDKDIFLSILALGLVGLFVLALFPLAIPILGCLAFGIFHYKRYKKLQKIKNLNTIKDLLEKYKDKPTDFEYHIASIYELMGYKVKVTPSTNDCGKDIIMFKDGEKIVVEVKLYSQDNLVGREKIQKLHSAMHDENANRAIFVTTSFFRDTAKNFADKHGIELVDSNGICELIKKVSNQKEQNRPSGD